MKYNSHYSIPPKKARWCGDNNDPKTYNSQKKIMKKKSQPFHDEWRLKKKLKFF